MAECVKTPPIVCCLMQHDSYVKLRYVTVITQKAPMLAHTLLCTAIIAKRRKNPLSVPIVRKGSQTPLWHPKRALNQRCVALT